MILAIIEKNIKQIIMEMQNYLKEYEAGRKPLYCVNIENAIEKQKL